MFFFVLLLGLFWNLYHDHKLQKDLIAMLTKGNEGYEHEIKDIRDNKKDMTFMD